MSDIPIGVIFDLGGVVFDSPMDRIADFEHACGLPRRAVASVISSSGDDGAWSRHERGEIDRQGFVERFSDEFGEHGYDVDVADLMARIEASFSVRPNVIGAVDRLRRAGVVVAALTNNWEPMSGHEVAGHFDVFVESVVEGTRKPETEIYLRTLERMGTPPRSTAMLDDIGANLRTARDLGMKTHKVIDATSAVTWLGRLFGWEIDDG